MKPMLAISMGDPAGIGPEVVLQSLDTACRVCRPVLFGHWPTFERLLRDAEITPLPVRRHVGAAPFPDDIIPFVHSGTSQDPIEVVGHENAVAQFEALRAATDAVLSGRCIALVTAPVSKKEMSLIVPDFIGHTEYLAERCHLADDDVTMVFASENLTVGLVATHLPLRDIPATITRAHYTRTLHHVIQVIRAIRGISVPVVAVAALNPHAGEDGLLGDEEIRTIGPFCRAFSSLNDICVTGPLPADTLFRDALAGKYDGVVAAYHDQAMIPLKLAGIGATVNITMGLPFIRTSPDHGVARDIARTGKSNPDGMRRAIELAVQLVQCPIQVGLTGVGS